MKGKYCDNWRKLLSPKRLYADSGSLRLSMAPNETPMSKKRTPFERDYERILFSPGFRRMMGKTQVQPFAEIDYVHNRLTHSIEVAAVCHSLAKRAFDFLRNRGDVRNGDKEAILWVTQAAGIAHDIGNPPYGHAGEAAIQSWAKRITDRIEPHARSWYDIELFDGNAQGFHLLSRPDARQNSYYHFTCASLGAVVKYPITSVQAHNEGKSKFDVFSVDEEAFQLIWGELGLIKRNKFLRHPLSYLSEAADDICYRILDFEDAVVSGILSEDLVHNIMINGLSIEDKEYAKSNNKTLQWIRGKLIGTLIDEFSRQFEINYESIMDGTFMLKDLRSCFSKRKNIGRMLSLLDKKYNTLFGERHKVLHEIGGYHQIPKLLDSYWVFLKAMFFNDERSIPDFDELPAMPKQMARLAWGKDYYDENKTKGFEWWLHAVVDYISGMTDGYLKRIALSIG